MVAIATPATAKEAAMLAEFGSVRLLRDIIYNGTLFPKGSAGIVVEIHDGGVGYEVEFSVPAEEVVGLRREDLQAI
jgi:hypothetical protein